MTSNCTAGCICEFTVDRYWIKKYSEMLSYEYESNESILWNPELLSAFIISISKNYFLSYLFWNHFMVKRFRLGKTSGRGGRLGKKVISAMYRNFQYKDAQGRSISTRSLNTKPLFLSGKCVRTNILWHRIFWPNFWVLVTQFCLMQKMYFPLTTLYYSKSQKQ